MKLSDWLRANDRSLEWLASRVDRSPSVMSRLARGHIRGTVDVAAKIESLTRGEVTALDLENAYQQSTLTQAVIASIVASKRGAAV